MEVYADNDLTVLGHDINLTHNVNTERMIDAETLDALIDLLIEISETKKQTPDSKAVLYLACIDNLKQRNYCVCGLKEAYQVVEKYRG